MKRVYRRLLFFVSTLAFLIAAPLIILYAVGYRTSLTADPVPVGVVLVETVPRRAELFVNDRRVGTTPRALPNLPAGEVRLRIEKEGYETWEKTVSVEPGRATEVRSVRLFPTNPTVIPVADDVASFSLSPNRQLVVVATTDEQIRITDTAGEVVGQPLQVGRPPRSLLWSPSSSSVLVEDAARRFHVLTVGEVLPQAVPALTGATQVVWDPRIPGRVLYLDAAGVLRALNVSSQAPVEITENVAFFATSARHILLVRDDGGVASYTLQGVAIEKAVSTPEGAVRRLHVTPGGKIAYEMDDGTLWVRLPGGSFELVSEAVRSAGWSPDEELLYVQPDEHSLHVYNVSDERSVLPLRSLALITRLSRSIKTPQWFAGGRHVLYQVDDELWITEIDTRDHPVSYQVDTTNVGTAEAEVGADGETMWYVKHTDGVLQLVAAQLVLE